MPEQTVASPVAIDADAAPTHRRITDAKEVQQIIDWLPLVAESRKMSAHLEQWLECGMVPGDQGLVAPATPVLYANADLSAPSVVLLFYGDGVIEDVLSRARTPSEGVSSSSESDDWRSASAAFYVAWVTDGTAHSSALLTSMLRLHLPVHEPFFFSCIAPQYAHILHELARDADATLEWSEAKQWHADTTQLRRTKDDKWRRVLDNAVRKEEDAAAADDDAASAIPVDSATSSSSSDPSPVITIAPLRREHVSLVVQNWPWSSPTAPGLIRHIIDNFLTRCVYLDGVPACWSLEQTYGTIGMVHTEPEFRGRGLAALCVESLSEAVLVRHPSRPAHAEIDDENVPSARLFARLGFQPTTGVVWAFWRPPKSDAAGRHAGATP